MIVNYMEENYDLFYGTTPTFHCRKWEKP